jgi:hypothetical protein
MDLISCLCKVENTLDRALQIYNEVAATAERAKNLHRHVTVILLQLNCQISELVMAFKLAINVDSNNCTLSLSEGTIELGCKHQLGLFLRV